MKRIVKTTILVLTATLSIGFSGRSNAIELGASGWPETTVAIEDLRPLAPFPLKIPGIVVKGRVVGPATLRVHVTTDGSVARAVLIESCGNADLDEASLHAMRGMRFEPYTAEGAPTEVTLVVPVHVPKRFGRTD